MPFNWHAGEQSEQHGRVPAGWLRVLVMSSPCTERVTRIRVATTRCGVHARRSGKGITWNSSGGCPHHGVQGRDVRRVRFNQPMTWQDAWRSTFGGEPPMPTSREESVQDVLARLIAGSSCDWFRTYIPTAEGRAFLMSLWEKAFGGQTGTPEWFVSEYDMPVPIEWRGDINYTYRCVDLACGDDQQLLIVELKTERQSYRPDQIPDYLRLVRHRNPSHATDVVLLGPLRPGYTPARGDGQRYAELTWDDLLPLLSQAFPTVDRAHQLGRFVEAELLTTPSGRSPSLPSAAALGVQSVEPGDLAAGEADPRDETHTAVAHALRMAPSVAQASARDATERGIDVAFGSEANARGAIEVIKASLSDRGWDDRVSVWLWRSISSGGRALTEAGQDTGLELRLAPRGADHRANPTP